MELVSERAIAKKREEVALLADRMKNANSFVVVDYAGLTVEQVTKLRRELLATGCELKVIKKLLAASLYASGVDSADIGKITGNLTN